MCFVMVNVCISNTRYNKTIKDISPKEWHVKGLWSKLGDLADLTLQTVGERFRVKLQLRVGKKALLKSPLLEVCILFINFCLVFLKYLFDQLITLQLPLPLSDGLIIQRWWQPEISSYTRTNWGRPGCRGRSSFYSRDDSGRLLTVGLGTRGHYFLYNPGLCVLLRSHIKVVGPFYVFLML